ncbi:8-oxoguanine glycosylase ogg1 [Spiromyces aspiralis]|uniref:8-oxoguanine glycosylase ogg1 n=1 Tax=Spiromyces aspiralis TaxID=68401 RepID=A0ACC1HE84_9FUNG|nr:8-oxoguanine glycosylase ogg1 [Spiromyces aspiralis]
MSLDKTDAVAVDTHIWQIAKRDYCKPSPSWASSSAGPSAALTCEVEDAIKTISAAKTLTQRAYNAARALFLGIFGPYCAWALGVLFAADLKSLEAMRFPSPSTVRPVVGRNKKRRISDMENCAPVPASSSSLRTRASNSGPKLTKLDTDGIVTTLDTGFPLRRRSVRLRVKSAQKA